MDKKYTLDMPLDPDAMSPFCVDEPVTSMRIACKNFNPFPFEDKYDGVRYLLSYMFEYTEVLVDLDKKFGEQKCYTFDNIEDALNAHLILTNPDMVIGDLIMNYNNLFVKNRPKN